MSTVLPELPCTQCGACCRRAWLAPDQLPVREDGVCAHLIELADKALCAIYEVRPPLCRYGYSYKPDVDPEEYLDLTISYCNGFQEEDKMPEHFRVKRK